ncbi:MAG: TetR/AcrR family transcriptional regulator [Bacteroidota bacterium]|nr:TetR/AcrR family transcriptional regulator [Bacteroidota bacterium]
MDKKSLRIIEQVTKLYGRYGIKSVTMDDAAHYLGISKKTLYEHFQDKEELVRNVILLEYEKHDRNLEEIRKRDLNALQELFEVYRILFGMFRDYNPAISYDTRKYYPELFNSLREVRRKKMMSSTLRNIKKGKKEGLFRQDLDVDIISKLHIFHIENLFENDLFTQDEISSFKIFHEIFVYHLNGMLSEKGKKYFDRNFKTFKHSVEIPVLKEETGQIS